MIERSEGALKHIRSAPAMVTVLDCFDSAEPELVDPATKSQTVKVHQFDVPDSHKHPDERKRKRRGSAPTQDGTPRASRPKLPTKSARDPERAVWLRQQVIQRLSSYGSSGLKQAVLVAGCQRQAPWDDVSPSEVLRVLRGLKDENKVKLSVGRWAMVARW